MTNLNPRELMIVIKRMIFQTEHEYAREPVNGMNFMFVKYKRDVLQDLIKRIERAEENKRKKKRMKK